MKINILSGETFNRISAGEVVENPAAVVKELVENAIDAGATHIEVRLENGGINSIEVSDNGCGIEREELPKALLPHATSKIASAEDLETISTLGFRGEALASISAVCEVEILTKTTEEAVGSKLISKNGKVEIVDAAVNGGTTVKASKLFFNTPARYKFLSSKTVEENRITRRMMALILANPDISFRYFTDGNMVYSSSGRGLRHAIKAVFPPFIYDKLIELDEYVVHDKNITVSGFIANPSVYKNNRSQQIFVLNGRVITDQALSNTVLNAYADRLMTRSFPVFVLNIVMPFEDVDINVHPTKNEVRFSEPKKICSAVFNAVNSALNGYDARTSAELFDRHGSRGPFAPTDKDEDENFRGEHALIANNLRYTQTGVVCLDDVKDIVLPRDRNRNEDDDIEAPSRKGEASSPVSLTARDVLEKVGNSLDSSSSTGDAAVSPDSVSHEAAAAREMADCQGAADNASDNRLFDLGESSYRVVGQLFDTYLVVETPGKAVFIDQHAMHERILFDSYMRELNEEVVARQSLLVPFLFEADAADIERLTENKELLYEAGFELNELSPDSVEITAVPAVLGNVDPERMLKEVLTLPDDSQALKKQLNKEAIASAACKAAIKGGESFTGNQIDFLMNKYVAGGAPLQCPHGRPITISFTKTDFEKLFRRKV